MKKFLLGKKMGMTRLFRSDGRVVSATVIAAGPCTVTAVRTTEKDGYTAVQIGLGTSKHIAKPQAGQFKKLGKFRHLRQFRVASSEGWEVGKQLDADLFAVGDRITVTGTSKGRGYQGVVKRHGFHGSPASHGHKDQLRKSGSIGSTAPQRVFKGIRMAGQMGNVRVSIRKLEVVEVRKDAHEILVKGAVPGAPRSLVLLQTEGKGA